MEKKKKWKDISISGILAVAFCCLICIIPIHNVKAEGSETTIQVPEEDISNYGIAIATQNALAIAEEKATAENPYTVKVPAGSYEISSTIFMPSYTTLDLTGVTLTRTTERNFIRVGYIETIDDGVTGYAYHDVSIFGGTFDGNALTATMIKAAHTDGFTLKDCTLKNSYNSHMIEIAAIKNVSITDCNFKDHVLDKDSSSLCYEAIQLDILVECHFNGYRAEALGIDNVTIDNCSFKNVARGVGSHTAILNQPFKNIKITNCTFKGCKSAAIQTLNWQKVKISGNTISNTPRGIAIYSMITGGQGTFLASVINEEGDTDAGVSTAYKTPAKDMKIKILNNSITINGKSDPYAHFTKGAITLCGRKITSTKTFSDGSGELPKGNYYVSGVTIKGNTIVAKGNGICLENARNVKISKNKIKSKKKAISIDSSSKSNKISNNKIKSY